MSICGKRGDNRFFSSCNQPGTTHTGCDCGAEVQAEIDAMQQEDGDE